VDAGLVAGGAAGRNGGFLLAGTAGFYHRTVERFGRERAAALYRLTLREMDRMTAETPEAIRRIGSVRLAIDEGERGDCRAHLEALLADGFPAERWEGPEGEGLVLPTDGTFQPVRRCRTLAQRALVRGARLFERTPALTISGNEVVTAEGKVSCRTVIVAVDGKLEAVLPELEGRVRTARLQMLATAPTDQVVPRPIYARYGWEYWQQLPDGGIALGGFRDVGGDGEWTHDIRPTRKVQRAMEDFLHDRLGVTAAVTHRWAAAASWNPSGLPLLEEVRPGVWAVGSYCGTGNVMGALAGRAVADLVSTGVSDEADLIRGKREAACQ
jgi:glycine/D-amino acid oxidase-like deaminating enzyme